MNNEDEEEVQQHVEDGEDDGSVASVRNDHDERDDDDDDDDDSVFIDVACFIENLRFENETFESASFYMSEDMTKALRDYSEEDLQRLAQSIDEDEQKKRRSIWIDLSPGRQHDVSVAERVTRLLERYVLSEVIDVDIKFPYYDEVEVLSHHSPVVDHYLSSLIDLMPYGANFERVAVPFLGLGDGAWSKFLNHFRMDRLCISTYWAGSDIGNNLKAMGLVQSLHDVPTLPSIELRLNSRDASPSVALLFQALLQLPTLTNLTVTMGDIAYMDTLEAALTGIVGLVSLSKSLKLLKAAVPRHGNVLECRQLLESALYSDVLNELELAGGSLYDNSLESDDTRTNDSIKRIVLSYCRIEAGGWSILHRFQGLQALELYAIRSAVYHTAYSELLLRLPRLEAFSDSSNVLETFGGIARLGDRIFVSYLRRFCSEATLAEFTQRVSIAPKLSKLKVETGRDALLPSLEDLVQHSKGSLTLIHADLHSVLLGEANFRYIWKGLHASSLTELNLGFKCNGLRSSVIIEFMSVLQRKRALKAFTGEFYVGADWEADCLDEALLDLITSSTTLKTFGLQLHSLRSSSTDEYNVAILRTLFRGLEHNQSVTTLTGVPGHRRAVAESLLCLLRHNYTLEHLHDYRSYEEPIEREIKWLLDLNRYKRRCLQAADDVPLGCWQGVVERIAMDKRSDVLYHFLRRMPHSALRARRGYRRPAPQTEQNLQRQTLARLLTES